MFSLFKHSSLVPQLKDIMVFKAFISLLAGIVIGTVFGPHRKTSSAPRMFIVFLCRCSFILLLLTILYRTLAINTFAVLFGFFTAVGITILKRLRGFS